MQTSSFSKAWYSFWMATNWSAINSAWSWPDKGLTHQQQAVQLSSDQRSLSLSKLRIPLLAAQSTHTGTRGLNMRTNVSSCISTFTLRALICMKIVFLILYSFMSLSFKSKKWSGIPMGRYFQNNKHICFIHNFQWILHIFTNMNLQTLQRWMITEWCMKFLQN